MPFIQSVHKGSVCLAGPALRAQAVRKVSRSREGADAGSPQEQAPLATGEARTTRASGFLRP
jgi:hypothetical protein